MSAQYEYSTCRSCLGSGCVHCGQRGQFRKRVYSRTQLALKRELFGNTDTGGQLQQRRADTERTLAWLKAVAV